MDDKERSDEAYSEQETQQRFDAALRGARLAGHKEKNQRGAKRGKRKRAVRRKPAR